jgi:hypothetical protein
MVQRDKSVVHKYQDVQKSALFYKTSMNGLLYEQLVLLLLHIWEIMEFIILETGYPHSCLL